MDTSRTRSKRTYDHRVRALVLTVGDPGVVADLGVPRSTALGWLRGEYRPVVTADVLNMDVVRLQAEVLKLRKRATNPVLSGGARVINGDVLASRGGHDVERFLSLIHI